MSVAGSLHSEVALVHGGAWTLQPRSALVSGAFQVSVPLPPDTMSIFTASDGSLNMSICPTALAFV